MTINKFSGKPRKSSFFDDILDEARQGTFSNDKKSTNPFISDNYEENYEENYDVGNMNFNEFEKYIKKSKYGLAEHTQYKPSNFKSTDNVNLLDNSVFNVRNNSPSIKDSLKSPSLDKSVIDPKLPNIEENNNKYEIYKNKVEKEREGAPVSLPSFLKPLYDHALDPLGYFLDNITKETLLGRATIQAGNTFAGEGTMKDYDGTLLTPKDKGAIPNFIADSAGTIAGMAMFGNGNGTSLLGATDKAGIKAEEFLTRKLSGIGAGKAAKIAQTILPAAGRGAVDNSLGNMALTSLNDGDMGETLKSGAEGAAAGALLFGGGKLAKDALSKAKIARLRKLYPGAFEDLKVADYPLLESKFDDGFKKGTDIDPDIPMNNQVLDLEGNSIDTRALNPSRRELMSRRIPGLENNIDPIQAGGYIDDVRPVVRTRRNVMQQQAPIEELKDIEKEYTEEIPRYSVKRTPIEDDLSSEAPNLENRVNIPGENKEPVKTSILEPPPIGKNTNEVAESIYNYAIDIDKKIRKSIYSWKPEGETLTKLREYQKTLIDLRNKEIRSFEERANVNKAYYEVTGIINYAEQEEPVYDNSADLLLERLDKAQKDRKPLDKPIDLTENKRKWTVEPVEPIKPIEPLPTPIKEHNSIPAAELLERGKKSWKKNKDNLPESTKEFLKGIKSMDDFPIDVQKKHIEAEGELDRGVKWQREVYFNNFIDYMKRGIRDPWGGKHDLRDMEQLLKFKQYYDMSKNSWIDVSKETLDTIQVLKDKLKADLNKPKVELTPKRVKKEPDRPKFRYPHEMNDLTTVEEKKYFGNVPKANACLSYGELKNVELEFDKINSFIKDFESGKDSNMDIAKNHLKSLDLKLKHKEVYVGDLKSWEKLPGEYLKEAQNIYDKLNLLINKKEPPTPVKDLTPPPIKKDKRIVGITFDNRKSENPKKVEPESEYDKNHREFLEKIEKTKEAERIEEAKAELEEKTRLENIEKEKKLKAKADKERIKKFKKEIEKDSVKINYVHSEIEKTEMRNKVKLIDKEIESYENEIKDIVRRLNDGSSNKSQEYIDNLKNISKEHRDIIESKKAERSYILSNIDKIKPKEKDLTPPPINKVKEKEIKSIPFEIKMNYTIMGSNRKSHLIRTNFEDNHYMIYFTADNEFNFRNAFKNGNYISNSDLPQDIKNMFPEYEKEIKKELSENKKDLTPPPIDKRNTYTIERANKDPFIVNKGDKVKVYEGKFDDGKTKQFHEGIVTGISHAKKEIKVNSIWYEAPFIYPMEYEFKNADGSPAKNTTVGADEPKRKYDVITPPPIGKEFELESFKDTVGKVMRGEDVSYKDITDLVKLVDGNKDKILFKLNKLSKADLTKFSNSAGRNSSEKKEKLVKYAYDDIINSMRILLGDGGTDTYVMDFSGENSMEKQAQEKFEKAIKNFNEEKHNKNIAANKEKHTKRVEELKAKKERVKSPKTLADYEFAKNYRKLTPEENRIYEDLKAEKSQSKKAEVKVEKVVAKIQGETHYSSNGENGGYSITKSQDTRDNKDLWTIKFDEKAGDFKELNKLMKSFSGGAGYSRFTRGFNFYEDPTEELLKRFNGTLDTKEAIEVKTEEIIKDKIESKSSKLRALADNMQKEIDKQFADRLENTNKRASQAASAREYGYSLQKTQKIIREIADKVESGELKYLSNITNKTQVEELQISLKHALYEYNEMLADTKYPVKLNQYKHDENAYQRTNYREELKKNSVVANEAIDNVIYPYPYNYTNALTQLVKNVEDLDIKGTKLAKQRIRSFISKQGNNYKHYDVKPILSDILKFHDMLKKNDPKYEHSSMKVYKRFKAMGLDTIEEYRAALREFNSIVGDKGKTPEDIKADKLRELERKAASSKIPSYFPTPKKVVSEMLDRADISEGEKVLEPSAGAGHIADSVGKGKIDVIEYNNTLNNILTEKGHNVVGNDFLEYAPGAIYDKIVMNPPFEKNADIIHVNHAYELLKPGGRIVAVMSEHPFFSNDKLSVSFREFLEEYGIEHEKLPEGSFKEGDVKTGVNTRLVVIEKPEAPIAAASQNDLDSYIRNEAKAVISELENSIKGKRIVKKFSDDTIEYDGIKRFGGQTVEQILDVTKRNYKDIKKSLEMIAKGDTKSKLSQTIVSILETRLTDGYFEPYMGYEIPPNEDYINIKSGKPIVTPLEKSRSLVKEIDLYNEYEEPYLEHMVDESNNDYINSKVIDPEFSSIQEIDSNEITSYDEYDEPYLGNEDYINSIENVPELSTISEMTLYNTLNELSKEENIKKVNEADLKEYFENLEKIEKTLNSISPIAATKIGRDFRETEIFKGYDKRTVTKTVKEKNILVPPPIKKSEILFEGYINNKLRVDPKPDILKAPPIVKKSANIESRPIVKKSANIESRPIENSNRTSPPIENSNSEEAFEFAGMGKEKESKFKSNTYRNSEFLSDPEVQKVIDDVNAMYNVKTQTQTYERALGMVETDMQGTLNRLLDKEEALTAEDSVAAAIIANFLRQRAKSTGDYTELKEFLTKFRPKVTKTAQGLQALSQWKKLTPEGTLMRAEKEINDFTEEIKDTLPEVLNDAEKKVKDLMDKLKELDKGALEDVVKGINDILNGKKVDDPIPPKGDDLEPPPPGKNKGKKDKGKKDDGVIVPGKEDDPIPSPGKGKKGGKGGGGAATNPLEKVPLEELLAKKIAGYSFSKGKRMDVEQKLIRTLFNVAKEQIEPMHIKEKDAPEDFIRAAIEQRELYEDIWGKAKEILTEKFKGDDEAIEVLEAYLDRELVPVFYEKDLNKAIKGKLTELRIDLNKLVREHRRTVEKTKDTLKQVLISKGFTQEQASYLDRYINSEFDRITTQKKEQILERMFKEKPKMERGSGTEAKRVIELSNLGVYSHAIYKDLVYDRLGLPVLNTDDVKFITDKMEQFMDETNERKKDIIFGQVKIRIANKKFVNNRDRLLAYMRISMLLNPKTILTRNTGGNIALMLGENAKDFYGMPIDYVVSKILKTPRTTTSPSLGRLKAQVKGGHKGLKEQREDIKFKTDTSPSRGQYELPGNRIFKNSILNTLDMLTRTGLQYGDRPFYEGAYADSMYQLQKLDGNLDNEQLSRLYALERTYQNDSSLSKGLKAGKQALNTITKNRTTIGVGDIAMPFTQTPANVVDKAIDYSGLGLIRGIQDLIKFRKEAKNNVVLTKEELFLKQKKVVNELSRGMVGFTLLGAGLMLAYVGSLTGSEDDNEKVRNAERSLGKYGNSIKIGNKYHSIDNFDPLATPMIIGADIAKSKEKGMSATKIAKNSAETLLTQSVFSGIKKLFGGYSLPDSFINTIASMPEMFMPTLGRQIAQTIDDYTRETYDPSQAKTIYNRLINKIPYLSEQLPIKVDVWGNDVKNLDGDNNIYNTMIKPNFTNNIKDNKAAILALDVYNNSGNSNILPKVAPKYINYTSSDKEKGTLVLTARDRVKFQKTMGQGVLEAYNKLAADNNFSKISYKDKEEKMSKIIDEMYKRAKKELFDSHKITLKKGSL